MPPCSLSAHLFGCLSERGEEKEKGSMYWQVIGAEEYQNDKYTSVEQLVLKSIK